MRRHEGEVEPGESHEQHREQPDARQPPKEKADKTRPDDVGEPATADREPPLLVDRPGHRVAVGGRRAIGERPREGGPDHEQPRERGVAPAPHGAPRGLEAGSRGVVDEAASSELREASQRRRVQRRLAEDQQRNGDEAADVDVVMLQQRFAARRIDEAAPKDRPEDDGHPPEEREEDRASNDAEAGEWREVQRALPAQRRLVVDLRERLRRVRVRHEDKVRRRHDRPSRMSWCNGRSTHAGAFSGMRAARVSRSRARTRCAARLELFLTQVVLAASGRVAWHVRLGRVGTGYGVLVVIVGLLTGISRSAHRFQLGLGGEHLLFVAIADMTVFSIFFGAAIAFRRRPQVHKRLMMVAATMLLVAAASRMAFLPLLSMRQAVWVSPILLAMAYDFRAQRVVHPVYLIGLAAFFVRALSPGILADTDTWSSVSHWLTGFVA